MQNRNSTKWDLSDSWLSYFQELMDKEEEKSEGSEEEESSEYEEYTDSEEEETGPRLKPVFVRK